MIHVISLHYILSFNLSSTDTLGVSMLVSVSKTGTDTCDYI